MYSYSDNALDGLWETIQQKLRQPRKCALEKLDKVHCRIR